MKCFALWLSRIHRHGATRYASSPWVLVQEGDLSRSGRIQDLTTFNITKKSWLRGHRFHILARRGGGRGWEETPVSGGGECGAAEWPRSHRGKSTTNEWVSQVQIFGPGSPAMGDSPLRTHRSWHSDIAAPDVSVCVRWGLWGNRLRGRRSKRDPGSLPVHLRIRCPCDRPER